MALHYLYFLFATLVNTFAFFAVTIPHVRKEDGNGIFLFLGSCSLVVEMIAVEQATTFPLCPLAMLVEAEARNIV